MKSILTTYVAIFLAAYLLTACQAQLGAGSSASSGVTVGTTDIGGVVTGAKGPEAGVWVIAETSQLPTRYAKIVVTDDRGRYLLPNLPKASYTVWVRGYGLVDSPKVNASPGNVLNLNAAVAPSAAAAAARAAAVDPPGAPGRRRGRDLCG